MDIFELAQQNQQAAWKIWDQSGIVQAWERIEATVHLVGSLIARGDASFGLSGGGVCLSRWMLNRRFLY